MEQTTYRNKWMVLAAVATGIFLATIDSSIVNIALPTLASYFRAPFSSVEWVVLAYLLTATTLMLGIGRLADMYGKKPFYLAGLGIFLVGSALCGSATSIHFLIIARIVQAIGASMIMALGSAIVTEAFPPSERGKALGMTGVMVSIGVIIGPTLGGLLLSVLNWRWLFFVNLPVGLIGIAMVAAYVHDVAEKRKQSFDWKGMAVLSIALLSFSLALTLGQEAGWSAPEIIALFVCAAFSAIVFIIIEVKTSQPLLELTLFKNMLFSINIATAFLTFVCNAGIILIIPFYLQNVLEFAPQKAGLLMAAMPIVVGIVAPIAGNLSDKIGPRILTAIGLGAILLSYLAISTVSTTTSIIGYIARFIPLGIGVGLFQSPNNSAVMGSVPRERLAIASGLLSVTRTLGQTTGVAVLGAIWATRSAILLSTGLSDQVSKLGGFQSAIHVTTIVIGFALVLSVFALIAERGYLPRKKGELS